MDGSGQPKAFAIVVAEGILEVTEKATGTRNSEHHAA
jgi:hypothetical protein